MYFPTPFFTDIYCTECLSQSDAVLFIVQLITISPREGRVPGLPQPSILSSRKSHLLERESCYLLYLVFMFQYFIYTLYAS